MFDHCPSEDHERDAHSHELVRIRSPAGSMRRKEVVYVVLLDDTGSLECHTVLSGNQGRQIVIVVVQPGDLEVLVAVAGEKEVCRTVGYEGISDSR